MRFFIALAIFSIMFLLSTNAILIFDDKFEQKFNNKRVWLNITQQMEGDGQQHVVVHKRSIDDIVIPVGYKMIEKDDRQKADKVENDGMKSKRDVKSDNIQIYYARSDVSINDRIIKVTQQQIGNGQQILVINKVKRDIEKN